MHPNGCPEVHENGDEEHRHDRDYADLSEMGKSVFEHLMVSLGISTPGFLDSRLLQSTRLLASRPSVSFGAYPCAELAKAWARGLPAHAMAAELAERTSVPKDRW